MMSVWDDVRHFQFDFCRYCLPHLFLVLLQVPKMEDAGTDELTGILLIEKASGFSS